MKWHLKKLRVLHWFCEYHLVGTAPILQPLVGYLLYRFAVHGSASHATMQYDVKDYHIALSAMLLVLFSLPAIVFFLPARRLLVPP